MHSYKNYFLYFVPRRIKLKNTLMCIFLFIIIIVLIDDYLNNHDDYEIESDELINIKRINNDNFKLENERLFQNTDGYNRDIYVKNHPKFQPVLAKYRIKSSTTTTTNSISISNKNIVQSPTIEDVNINYEFELPMLNTSRLLLDDNYRKHIQELFFNNEESKNSFILFSNNSDDLMVKECKCEYISCLCCVNITVEDINFNHHSCVNITYDKGYEVIKSLS